MAAVGFSAVVGGWAAVFFYVWPKKNCLSDFTSVLL